MTPHGLVAKNSHMGEPCYLCDKRIKKGDDVQYYGGPFVMHSACITRIIDEHSGHGPIKPKGD